MAKKTIVQKVTENIGKDTDGLSSSSELSDANAQDEKELKAQEAADKQEAKTTKRQLPPTPSEQDADQATPVRSAGRKGSTFGRVARAVGWEIFSTMYPRISGMMEDLMYQSGQNRTTSQKLDTDMQLVTSELNETNNLLMQLNAEMTKMLGLLGQLISKNNSGGSSSGLGSWLKDGMVAAGLVTAAAAYEFDDIVKWLDSGAADKPKIEAENLTEAPPSPDAVAEATPESVFTTFEPPAQTADAFKNNPMIQTVSDTGSDVKERTMAATREFESGSSKLISDYGNMTPEQQSSTGDLGEALNTYKGSVAEKYGVKDFAMKSSDYVAQEGQTAPNFQVNESNNAGTKVDKGISGFNKRSDVTDKRNVDINAEKITFNADGMLFKQTGIITNDGGRDRQGYGSIEPPGFDVGPGGGEGDNGMVPPKPDLSTITSKTGVSTQVATQYKDRFQSLVDWLDVTSPGYIKVLGGYEPRMNVNDPTKVSAHAFGAALDINPSENPNRTTQTTLPPEIASVAASLGLGWGMNWTSNKDPMHFSATTREGGSPIVSGGVEAMTPPATAPVANMVRPTITAKLSTPTVPGGGSTPSVAPSQTSSSVQSDPAKPAPSMGNEKLRDTSKVGNVEPEDAHAMYPIWFGPALSSEYNKSMPASGR